MAGWVCRPPGRGVCGAGHQWAPFPVLLLVSVRQPRLQEVVALHGRGCASLTPHWLQPGGGHPVDRPQRWGTESSGGRPRQGGLRLLGGGGPPLRPPQPGSTARSPGRHCPPGHVPWVTPSGVAHRHGTEVAGHWVDCPQPPLTAPGGCGARGGGPLPHPPRLSGPPLPPRPLCPLSTLQPLFLVLPHLRKPPGGCEGRRCGDPRPLWLCFRLDAFHSGSTGSAAGLLGLGGWGGKYH